MTQSEKKLPEYSLDDALCALRWQTPPQWVEAVMANFGEFLQDHAAAEKKASGMALSMVSHYPDRPLLVEVMADIAVEEMMHFREVIRLLHKHNLQLGNDSKDHYVHALRNTMRNGSDWYLLDRLLIGGIIEKRGFERFSLVAQAAQDTEIKAFYQAIAASEERHFEVFFRLAFKYFNPPEVTARLDELLDIEADIAAKLPIKAVLH